MKRNPVGIIDSGVGGFSIWREITKLMPYEDIIYIADQKNFPYGIRPAKEIRKLVEEKLQFFIKQNVKIVVIACNTATVYTLPHFRKKYRLPIVGTVPVVKKAAELSKNKIIAVISTHNTTKSKYQKNLIKAYCSNVRVFSSSEDELVSFVEDLKINSLPRGFLGKLTSLKNKNMDVLALGCTHFAFARPILKRILGRKVNIIDSSGAVARQVKRVLKNNNVLEKNKNPNYEFYTTGDIKKFKKQIKFLINVNADVKKL